MEVLWFYIDKVLAFADVPVTETSRFVALAVIIIVYFFLGYLILSLALESRHYARIRKGTGKPKQEQQDQGLSLSLEKKESEEDEPFTPVLRARWDLISEEEYYKAKKVMARERVTDWGLLKGELDPLIQAYLVEMEKDQYTLYLGKEDIWMRFRHPDNLTDSSKLGLIQTLSTIWIERDYQERLREIEDFKVDEDKKEELRSKAEEESKLALAELKSLDSHSWKDGLRTLARREFGEGLEFSWDSFFWKVLDEMGPHRVIVEGNTLVQGEERMKLVRLKTKDRQEDDYPEGFYLLNVVEFVGGRQIMGGRMMLWNNGTEVDVSEVREWSDREITISRKRLEAVMNR